MRRGSRSTERKCMLICLAWQLPPKSKPIATDHPQFVDTADEYKQASLREKSGSEIGAKR
jgi:hypothetical protein